YRDPKGLRGLQVDHELELRGLLHRQVSRRGAFEKLVHKDCGAPPSPTGIKLLRPIRHEPSRLGEASVPTNYRQPMLCRQLHELWEMQPEKRRGEHHDAFGLGCVCRSKRARELVGTADLDNMQVYAQDRGGLL